MYIGYFGRLFHPNNDIIEMKHKLYIPYCIVHKIFGKKKIPIEVIMNFLEDIKIYMNKDAKNLKILSNYIISSKDMNNKCENNLCFGIDEYFLNNILFTYLLKKKLCFIFQLTY